MSNQGGDKEINANPTKGLFIYMLTKDIALDEAIIDLVDNSVDGARGLETDNDFTNLWVRLEINKDKFVISDNCGGIPVDVAKNYAFRFGRPEDFSLVAHSIGQFGVGMKRALFKMGRQFKIESSTNTSSFSIDINVEQWQNNPDWTFQFSKIERFEVREDSRGTTITVTSLYETVAEQLAVANFASELRESVKSAHQQAMKQGLKISINSIPVDIKEPNELLESDIIKPAYHEFTSRDENKPVKVRIWAGVADLSLTEAGWYVFCNGRLILEADQTQNTGWQIIEDVKTPKFHAQFARFRGYVFFDCDDSTKLPWNTTKTGVDLDSPLYRYTRQKMVSMMRPVIDFLNKLDAEKDSDESGRPFETAINEAKTVPLTAAPDNRVFLFPDINEAQQKIKLATISYKKPKELVERVIEATGVLSNKELGEKTFEYYVEMEELNK